MEERDDQVLEHTSGLDVSQQKVLERKRELDHRLGRFVRGHSLLSPPRSSIYGVCFVMPLIAKQTGWPPALVCDVVQSYLVLALCWVLQGAFVYEIVHIRVLQAEACNEAPDSCADRGFVPVGRIFLSESTRWMLCDDGEIPAMTRLLCISVFCITIFSDLQVVFDMILVLKEVGNHGDWLVGRASRGICFSGVDGTSRQVQAHELGFQVAGIPYGLKIAYFCVLVLPKFVLFWVLLCAGSYYLFNEPNRVELILNAAAFCFVRSLDRLLLLACTPQAIQEKMDNLEGYSAEIDPKARQRSLAARTFLPRSMLYEGLHEEEEDDDEEEEEEEEEQEQDEEEADHDADVVEMHRTQSVDTHFFEDGGVRSAHAYRAQDYISGILIGASAPAFLTMMVVCLLGWFQYRCGSEVHSTTSATL